MPSNKPRKITRAMQHLAQIPDRIFSLMPKLASKLGIETGKPFLVERDGILALHFDAATIQSEMSIDKPDELVIGYTRSMMSFLLLEPSPARIAMIGLGGGSLAKYCYRYLPQTDITIAEINPDVIALRNEFAIPADTERFRILACDGAEWVKNTTFQPDVLIVDGYDAVGLPEQLSSPQFYYDCYTHLADNGILVANLWGCNADYPLYLARIQNQFSEQVVVIDADDSINKLVIAVKNGTSLLPSRIKHHANRLSLSHPIDLTGLSKVLIRALRQADL